MPTTIRTATQEALLNDRAEGEIDVAGQDSPVNPVPYRTLAGAGRPSQPRRDDPLPMIAIGALPGGGFTVQNVGAGDLAWREHTFSSAQGLRGFLRAWAEQAHQKGKAVQLSGQLV